jgi:hypothetical protein
MPLLLLALKLYPGERIDNVRGSQDTGLKGPFFPERKGKINTSSVVFFKN